MCDNSLKLMSRHCFKNCSSDNSDIVGGFNSWGRGGIIAQMGYTGRCPVWGEGVVFFLVSSRDFNFGCCFFYVGEGSGNRKVWGGVSSQGHITCPMTLSPNKFHLNL